MKRTDLGQILRCITGHNFMNRHNHLVDPIKYPNPICRKCLEDSSLETASHILAECPALHQLRANTFNTQQFDISTMDWTPIQVSSFLQNPSISHLEDNMDNQ